MIVHGGKFGKKHVAKCGKWRNAILKDGEAIVNYVDGMSKVTCRNCIANHKPGKC